MQSALGLWDPKQIGIVLLGKNSWVGVIRRLFLNCTDSFFGAIGGDVGELGAVTGGVTGGDTVGIVLALRRGSWAHDVTVEDAVQQSLWVEEEHSVIVVALFDVEEVSDMLLW